MKIRLKSGLIGVLVLAAGVGQSADLRNATLKITRTNAGQAEISWLSRSAVPAPGLQLMPSYQLEKSPDLTNWSNVGGSITGANGQTLRVTNGTAGTTGFYRVKSIVSRPFGRFNQANLSNGELALADFFGAEFFAANLSGANLTGADMRGTDMRFADMSDVVAEGADFFATDLLLATMPFALIEHADMSYANLEAADLFGGSLLGSDLRSTILAAADLRFVTLHNTLIDSQTMLDSKWVRVWQLINGQATNTVFANLDFSIADMREADLSAKSFAGSDFSSTLLAGADLRGANFANANLRFVDFFASLMDTNTVIEAKSRLVWEIVNQGAVGRDLHGTNLSSTFLVNANMQSVNLTNANLSLAILFRANLQNANLRNANFSSTDLTQANLFGAITNGTSFSGATFSQTIMPDGSIRNF